MSDEDNDDKIVDANNKTNRSDKKISNLQNQVNDVIEDMKINIEKVVDRGQSLNDLNDRSDQLGVAGDLFSKRSRNLRKSMWLRTCRARMYLSIAVGFFLFIIFCNYSKFY
jgi:vesicle-associated membrane protein 4